MSLDLAKEQLQVQNATSSFEASLNHVVSKITEDREKIKLYLSGK
jgi:hypothetical protein